MKNGKLVKNKQKSFVKDIKITIIIEKSYDCKELFGKKFNRNFLKIEYSLIFISLICSHKVYNKHTCYATYIYLG